MLGKGQIVLNNSANEGNSYKDGPLWFPCAGVRGSRVLVFGSTLLRVGRREGTKRKKDGFVVLFKEGKKAFAPLRICKAKNARGTCSQSASQMLLAKRHTQRSR